MTTPPRPFGGAAHDTVPGAARVDEPAGSRARTSSPATACAPSAELLHLALVGSRAQGFHHDLASKLQGLMMSLDELSELEFVSGADPQRCVSSAQQALREALVLLNNNRALTKPPVLAPTALPSLLRAASERARVSLSGDIPDVQIHVGAPAMTHALSLVLDVCAGPGRARTLDVTVAFEADHVVISIPVAGPPVADEPLAIAAFAIGRPTA